MDWVVDASQRLAVWVFTAVLGTVGAWCVWVTVSIHRHYTRLKLLEQSVNKLPASIDELKEMLDESRKDRETQIERLYDKLDAVRQELKKDIEAVRARH